MKAAVARVLLQPSCRRETIEEKAIVKVEFRRYTVSGVGPAPRRRGGYVESRAGSAGSTETSRLVGRRSAVQRGGGGRLGAGGREAP